MVEFNIGDDIVDIDIEDFMNECDDYDITEIIEWLRDEGHILDNEIEDHISRNANDEIWNETVSKLIDAKHRLTNQDEIIVLTVTDKL